MAWLLRDGQVLASVSLAGSLAERARGFSGRDAADGALYVSPTRFAHALGTGAPLDIAFVDEQLTVLSTCRLSRLRLGRFCRGAYGVIEAEAGAFERWALRPGDRLEIKR